MPAVARSDLALDPRDGPDVGLPAGTPLDLVGLGADGRAWVRCAAGEGEVDAAAVAVLPFTARLRTPTGETPAGAWALVLGVESSGLKVDLAGPFGVDAQPATVPAAVLDMSIPGDAATIGDLRGGTWVPDGTAAAEVRLLSPATVRGVPLPSGAKLHLEPSGRVDAARLTAAAEVAGMSVPAGAELAFVQGCDVELRLASEPPRCLLLDEGRLVAP